MNQSAAPKIILLVGMMGAGKTQIGSALAKNIDVPFYDTDVEIEKASGMKIRDMFEIYGEQVFRETEQRIMLRLLSDDMPKVISSGGGAYLTEEVRGRAKKKAVTIWVNSPIPVLLERVRRTKRRPLVSGDDAVQVMTEILEKRRPLYENADIHIENDGSRRLYEIVAEIIEKVKESE